MAGQFIAKTVSQEVVTGTTQPIYLGGTDPSGSDAPIAISSGKVANLASTTTIGGNPVASQNYANSLLAEYTVTGSAVTSINFSGLDINTHKSYRVEMEIYNPTGSNSSISMFVNGNLTMSNYYNAYIVSANTTINALRANSNQILFMDATYKAKCVHSLALVDGQPALSGTMTDNLAANMRAFLLTWTTTFAVGNITQLTFTASIANSIGVGSKIRIFRGDV